MLFAELFYRESGRNEKSPAREAFFDGRNRARTYDLCYVKAVL